MVKCLEYVVVRGSGMIQVKRLVFKLALTLRPRNGAHPWDPNKQQTSRLMQASAFENRH